VEYTELNKALLILGIITTYTALVFFGRTSILMFFIRYEFVVFPVILRVFVFGSQPEKISSTFYICMYTGGISLPFMVEIIKMEGFLVHFYVSPVEHFMCTGLFLRKRPVYIFHGWLPKAHVEAPTSTRMLLAGILLKVGIFGLIKIAVFFNTVSFIMAILRLMGVLFIPFTTSISVERKIMTAYRRVTHINLAIYGLNVISNISLSGAGLIRVRHGFVSSIIFCFVGIIYNMNGVRVIHFLTGLILWSVYISIRVAFVFLANAGVPPFVSFWGEMFMLVRLIRIGVFIFLFLFFYLIYSFYYSIYILIHFLKPSSIVLVRVRILVLLILRNLAIINFFVLIY